MQRHLTYDDDREFRSTARISVAERTIPVEACIYAGGEKPNEDAFAVLSDGDRLTLAVFDGTSSLRPITALGETTGARFASHTLRDLLPQVASIQSMRELMLVLNRRLLDANKALGGTLDDTHSLPSSTATIVRLDIGMGFLDFAHLGDSFLLIEHPDGCVDRLTDDRNQVFDQRMFALIQSIADEHGQTPRVARTDPSVTQAHYDMFIARNNAPDGSGSGLLNGDPNAAIYVQEGGAPLAEIRTLVLGSDGLVPPGWSLESEDDCRRILSTIYATGLDGLTAITRAGEDADPDWWHARYKHSDDATGIVVRITPSKETRQSLVE